MARSPRAKAPSTPGSTSETAGPTVTPATPAPDPPPRSGPSGHDPRPGFDDPFERFRTHGAEAAEMAVDQLDLARELIVEQVKARPLASAAAAVGVGLFLGLLLAGPRR